MNTHETIGECGYTWKLGLTNRLVQWLFRVIEHNGERHIGGHHCVRDPNHNDELYSSMHMCWCATTHWPGWNQ